MSDASTNVGLVSRPGFNDALPPRLADDSYDALEGVSGYTANPYGPNPVLLTANSNP
jgi:hypothetical protein